MSRWAGDPYDDEDDSDRYDERERNDDRAEDFRCYGCELNIGRGGYCDSCEEERHAQFQEWFTHPCGCRYPATHDVCPVHFWHPPSKGGTK